MILYPVPTAPRTLWVLVVERLDNAESQSLLVAPFHTRPWPFQPRLTGAQVFNVEVTLAFQPEVSGTLPPAHGRDWIQTLLEPLHHHT